MQNLTPYTSLSLSEKELGSIYLALNFAKREIKKQIEALPENASGLSINIFNNLQKDLPALIRYIEIKIDEMDSM